MDILLDLCYGIAERVAIRPDGIFRIAMLGTQPKETGLRIYVGNLPYEITEDELREAFGAHGQVESVTIIRDRQTGRAKGFGFVEMASSTESQAAINALNGKEFHQRTLTVNEARPREERSFAGGAGGGGFRGGDRGGDRGGAGGSRKPRW